jgi:hypothetical protein
MNGIAKLVTVAAAVAAVALIVVLAIPRGGSGIGGPTVTPSTSTPPSPSSSPSASIGASPSAVANAFPPDGPLTAGRHTMVRDGVSISIFVPTTGWRSEQGYFINKDVAATPDGASFLFWDPDPKGVYADPCAQQKGPAAGPSTADLATVMSKIPGTDLGSGPSDVTVGGLPAKLVVIRVREDAGCEAGPNGFHLWYGADESAARYATALGSTYRVWIVDVGGKRVVIEAESFKGAGPSVDQEIQSMVDSIRFE